MTNRQITSWFSVAISVVFFPGCGNQASSKKLPQLRAVVVCETGDPSAESEITIRTGDTLSAISQRRYGSEHYYRVILLCNNLEAEREIPSGTRLRTPDLRLALMEHVREAAYQPAVEWIACAQVKYRKQESQLRQLADSSRQNRADMPGDVVQTLMEATEDLNAAAANLEQRSGPEKSVPSRAIGQLREAAGLLTTLARGEFDGYGYDRDMVNQRLALAMTYLILWARVG